ncbi:Dysferlin [Manis javanica]|nr:Dysferlin [Manis javanica]
MQENLETTPNLGSPEEVQIASGPTNPASTALEFSDKSNHVMISSTNRRRNSGGVTCSCPPSRKTSRLGSWREKCRPSTQLLFLENMVMSPKSSTDQEWNLSSHGNLESEWRLHPALEWVGWWRSGCCRTGGASPFWFQIFCERNQDTGERTLKQADQGKPSSNASAALGNLIPCDVHKGAGRHPIRL